MLKDQTQKKTRTLLFPDLCLAAKIDSPLSRGNFGLAITLTPNASKFASPPQERVFLLLSKLPHPVLPFLNFSVLPRKNPRINQGFLSPAEPTKTLEKQRKNAILTKEIPWLKLTREFQKTKERKDRAEVRVIVRQLSGKNCLAVISASRH